MWMELTSMFGISSIYSLFKQQEEVNSPFFKLNLLFYFILQDLDFINFGYFTEIFLLNRTLNFLKLPFDKFRKLVKMSWWHQLTVILGFLKVIKLYISQGPSSASSSVLWFLVNSEILIRTRKSIIESLFLFSLPYLISSFARNVIFGFKLTTISYMLYRD